jgi:hypothetical protein
LKFYRKTAILIMASGQVSSTRQSFRRPALKIWTISSVVERSVHIGKATGSSPVSSTKYQAGNIAAKINIGLADLEKEVMFSDSRR